MRIRLLLGLFGALFLCIAASSAFAASNSPGTTQGGSGDDLTKFMEDFFGSSPSGAISNLKTTAQNIITNTTTTSRNIAKDTLIPEATSVNRAIFFPILIAEIVFFGIRVMMRTPVADQLAKLVVTTFVYVIVSSGQPQNIISTGMIDLMAAGREVGGDILKAGGCDGFAADGNEPIDYWFSWIGTPPDKDTAKSDAQTIQQGGNLPSLTAKDYKFSIGVLMARIWGDTEWAKNIYVRSTSGGTTGEVQPKEGSSEAMTAAMLVATGPFQIIAMAITVASIQTAAFVAVIFTAVSVLAGSIFTFYIAFAFGIAILPLMYFKHFERAWPQYLISLGALGLVPCLYYIFAAIGFVFSVKLFDLLFPIPGDSSNPGGLAVVLNGVFVYGVYSVISMMGPLALTIVGAVTSVMAKVLYALLLTGRVLYATTIVGSFIFGGNLFASLAISSAFRWNQGFASEEMLSKISEFFNGLQGSVGTGLGQMYSETAGKGVSAISGVGRGFFGGGVSRN